MSASKAAFAAPMAALEYVETSLGGGQFRYDYTLRNLGDPVLDAGFDIFDFVLTLPAGVTLDSAALPADWDVISGAGFVEAFSLAPGLPPLGADVAGGESLGLFSFTFDDQIGSVPFQALFTNPGDPSNPVIAEGVTSVAQVPVPEPASVLLLTTGIAVFARSRLQRR